MEQIFICLSWSRVQEGFAGIFRTEAMWIIFIFISLITAGWSTVYGFPVLHSRFLVWDGWADLGRAKISLSPTRSDCGSLERRLCNWGGGRGCLRQHSVGSNTNGCVDDFSHWRAGLGSSKLCSWAEGEFSPVLPPRSTSKAKSRKVLLLHFAPLQLSLDSSLLWMIWGKIVVVQGSGELLSITLLWLMQTPHRCHYWVIPRAAFGSCCCPFSWQLLEEGGLAITFASLSYHRD